jgi:hypothetical protein
MLKHSNVLIDGNQLRPMLDQTAFVKYTMTRTFFIEQPERMLLNTAIVGVIVTYLTKEIPQKVTVDWDLFSERIQKIPSTAVDPAGPFASFVTPDDNVFVWTNYLQDYKVPTVAAVSIDESITTLGLPLATVFCLPARSCSGHRPVVETNEEREIARPLRRPGGPSRRRECAAVSISEGSCRQAGCNSPNNDR